MLPLICFLCPVSQSFQTWTNSGTVIRSHCNLECFASATIHAEVSDPSCLVTSSLIQFSLSLSPTHLFSVALGFELRVLHVLDRCSATWATPTAPSALIIFQWGLAACLTVLGSDPPILLPASWGDRLVVPYPGLLVETGSWELFSLGLFQTSILLISALQNS
jgi:hypothetical protein